VSWLPLMSSAEPAARHRGTPPRRAGDVRPALGALRKEARRSRSRAALALVAGFLSYAALSLFAPELAGRPVAGVFTVGIVIGFVQIAVVIAVAAGYTRAMRTRVDPLTDRVLAAEQDDMYFADATAGGGEYR
jgi:uncharacterized membrane protein (DUF485 family)